MKADAGRSVTWPRDLYELVALPGSGRFGETLAVCVAHQGRHVRHGRPPDDTWCQVLAAHRPMPRMARALARLRAVERR